MTTDTKPTVLVVDDSKVDLEMISIVCDALGCRVDLASDGPSAVALYREHRHDLLLTDYMMEPMNGIYVISQVKEINADAICILMTGFPDGAVRLFAAEGGNSELITKPTLTADLKETLRLALNLSKGATAKVTGIALTNRMDTCPGLVGESPAIRHIREQVASVIKSQKTTLLSGPKSTEKRQILEFIHSNGPHAAKAMVKVQCDLNKQELRENLIAEGGKWRHLLRQSENGTLVLDEILSLPLSVQRDLADEFDKISSRMHVIAISDSSLEDALEQGRIDDEFYFKVTMDPIEVLPKVDR